VRCRAAREDRGSPGRQRPEQDRAAKLVADLWIDRRNLIGGCACATTSPAAGPSRRATILKVAAEVGVRVEEFTEFERLYALRTRRVKAVFPGVTPITAICRCGRGARTRTPVARLLAVDTAPLLDQLIECGVLSKPRRPDRPSAQRASRVRASGAVADFVSEQRR